MSGTVGRSSVVLLDNRDSFVHTVARYLRELGADSTVLRSDAVTVAEVAALRPTHLLVSPGPCTPTEAGISTEAVRSMAHRVPVLGICLGHQCVAAAFGASVGPARVPRHGRSLQVRHRGRGILEGVKNPLEGALYHSLAVDRANLPSSLIVEADTEDGEIMALRHRTFSTWGVQFHPESVLTPEGRAILANFLRLEPCPPESMEDG